MYFYEYDNIVNLFLQKKVCSSLGCGLVYYLIIANRIWFLFNLLMILILVNDYSYFLADVRGSFLLYFTTILLYFISSGGKSIWDIWPHWFKVVEVLQQHCNAYLYFVIKYRSLFHGWKQYILFGKKRLIFCISNIVKQCYYSISASNPTNY